MSPLLHDATVSTGPGLPHYASRSHSRHTTLGRTPLDKWLARRGDLYLTTRNNHKRQTSMCAAAFETAIPRGHRYWQCSGNVLGYYSGGTHFDSWTNYRLSQLKVRLVVFCLQDDVRMVGYPQGARAVFFQLFNFWANSLWFQYCAVRLLFKG